MLRPWFTQPVDSELKFTLWNSVYANSVDDVFIVGTLPAELTGIHSSLSSALFDFEYALNLKT